MEMIPDGWTDLKCEKKLMFGKSNENETQFEID